MSPASNDTSHPAVIVVGAGVTGLLLAQYLRNSGVAFEIFERDADLDYRGLGWGLTLQWCLSALRSLLPEDLVQRLHETYVDQAAVRRGETSRFPFYDCSTGELKNATPDSPESQRIRVTRQKLRRLLATGIDVQWEKAFQKYEVRGDSVRVSFEDGSSCTGGLLVACDGASSRIRRILFPDQQPFKLPVGVMGIRVDYPPQQCEAMRKLDPFFLQMTSANGAFAYFSVLDAPGNEGTDSFTYQMVISWPLRPGFLGNQSPIVPPATDKDRLELARALTSTWAEPFRSFVLSFPEDTEVKALELTDWPPPRGLRTEDRVVLMGDAFHPMTMYRGEGANHAIVDVQDFAEIIGPVLGQCGDHSALRAALDIYSEAVVDRARPAVFASRQACLDAHDWGRLERGDSPLLTKRAMKLEFPEEAS